MRLVFLKKSMASGWLLRAGRAEQYGTFLFSLLSLLPVGLLATLNLLVTVQQAHKPVRCIEPVPARRDEISMTSIADNGAEGESGSAPPPGRELIRPHESEKVVNVSHSDAHEITDDGMPGRIEGPGEEAESIGQVGRSDGDGAKQREANMSAEQSKKIVSLWAESGQDEKRWDLTD